MSNVLVEQVNQLDILLINISGFRDEDFDRETLHTASKMLWGAVTVIARELDLDPYNVFENLYSDSLEAARSSLFVELKQLKSISGRVADDSDRFLRLLKAVENASETVEGSLAIVHRAGANKIAHPYEILESGQDIALVGHWDELVTVPTDGPDRISVSMYIDGDDAATREVMLRVEALVDALGYGEAVDDQIERGSIFRRFFAKLKSGLTSREARENFTKAERALELLTIDARQAQVDEKIAGAVNGLVNSFTDVPRACVRVGSIFFVKYTLPSGPIILARNLSQIEIRAMERFPEIQREPEKAFEALALAVTQLEGPESSRII